MRNLQAKPILAIESSCDEMSAALVHQGKLLSQSVASQDIHAQYGGVVPELAARQHHKQIIPIVTSALEKAKLTLKDIGSIAVTQGPGLLGSLLVGVSFANGLALGLGLPIIGVHHMRAHLLANWLTLPHPRFPCLGLTLSGGHTQLIWVKDFFDMTLLGSTEDDAIGEAFDKAAKMLGIPYPGGPQVDLWAAQGNPNRFHFPITVMPNYSFSFSGIKTSFRYLLDRESAKDPHFITQNRYDLCASLQAALVQMIIIKVKKALQATGAKSLILGGGVVNNTGIQSALKDLAQAENIQLFIPPPPYTTDNAAMIAITGYYALQTNQKTQASIEPMPRMPLTFL